MTQGRPAILATTELHQNRRSSSTQNPRKPKHTQAHLNDPEVKEHRKAPITADSYELTCCDLTWTCAQKTRWQPDSHGGSSPPEMVLTSSSRMGQVWFIGCVAYLFGICHEISYRVSSWKKLDKSLSGFALPYFVRDSNVVPFILNLQFGDTLCVVLLAISLCYPLLIITNMFYNWALSQFILMEEIITKMNCEISMLMAYYHTIESISMCQSQKRHNIRLDSW